MINKLTDQLLHDLEKLCLFAYTAQQAVTPKAKNDQAGKIYQRSRECLLDIIRECSLGEQPNWDVLNDLRPTLPTPK